MESLNQYQIFYEVAKWGSFSLAAEKLFISQPAISKSICNLEKELNTVLFFRSSRGSRLTPEGELLFGHVDKALTSLKSGETILKGISEKGIQTLSIGISTTLCKFVLLPSLKSFLNEHPNVRLKIFCQSTSDTLNALRNEEIDLGLVGTYGQPEDTSLIFSPLKTIEDIFVTSDSYLVNRKSISGNSQISDFMQNAVFILLNKENVSRKHIDAYFHQLHMIPENIMEVNHMDLAIDFAKAGLGIACVISDFIQNELSDHTLIDIRLGARVPKRQISFAYSKNFDKTSVIQSLIQHYQEVVI